MRHLLFFSIFVLLQISCTVQKTEDNNRVIAEVSGNELTLEQARQIIPVYIYERDSIAAIRDYRRNWVKRQVLLQEANRLGLENNEDVRKKIRLAKEDIIATALLDLVQKEVKEEGVSMQEAQAYYQAHREQFVLNERHVRYRHIITETLNASQNARNALHRGDQWEDVARRYSINPEEAIQNSNMFWPLSNAAKDYDTMNQYLKVIGITEISPVSEENGQYHFVQLREDKSKGDHPDLDWVLGHISEWLLVEKQRRIISTYERNLFLKAESNNEIKLYDVHTLDEAKEILINTEPDTLISN
ncbi:MAG: peptidyl-prolyl cis-trans isomerase [Balneolales bacterium]